MGWMWASPPRSPSSSSSESKSEASTSTSTLAHDASTKQTENDYGDPEIAKFMAQLQAEFGVKTSSEPQPAAREPQTQLPSSPSPPTSPRRTSLWSSIWGGSSPQGPTSSSASTLPNSIRPEANPLQGHHHAPSPNWTREQLDPVSESLLPTTMSCRQAFDAAFYCASMGGQFNTVYRYGSVRSCSEHWDDFWFCMRTRAYSGKMKEEVIRDHYRKREFARYGPGRPSSTDVWESREEKLPEGVAFRAAWEPPVQDDEEWRVGEIERRRQFSGEMDGKTSETET